MGYVVTGLILVVVCALAIGIMIIRHENGPSMLPSIVGGGRPGRQSSRVAAGDTCACGGTLGIAGDAAAGSAELLGCTGCSRSWTMDGRKITRR